MINFVAKSSMLMIFSESNEPTDIKPLVSFIVTFHDTPIASFCRCIDSLLALSLSAEEREIIVVDDASGDSPITDVRKYDDDIVYIRKTNIGTSMARNIGLTMAAGRFIQFVDSHDTLLGIPYEHCLDLVRYKGVDVVSFNFAKRDGRKSFFNDSVSMSGSEYMHNHSIESAIGCYIFSKAIIGSLRFNTKRDYGEDDEFTPQMLLRSESLYHTEAAAYLRGENDGGVVNGRDLRTKVERIDEGLNVILHLQNMLDTLPSSDNVAIRRRIAQLTMDYIYNAIVLTRSPAFVKKKVDELRRYGLYPLPDRDYGQRYNWFRRMANHSIGLNILIGTIPLLAVKK